MSADVTSGRTGAGTRRGVLAGAGAVGAAAALAACGGGDSGGGSTGAGTSTPASGATGTGTGGQTLGKVADIPVGGGKIFEAARTVVTQPTAGAFKAFSAVCTHMGCLVTKVADGKIDCPCHGSQFSITDGAVLRAAPGMTPQSQAPLPARSVTVRGDQVAVE